MLAVTAFGSLMTLVTVALGEIADDLGSTRATMTWAITGLTLAMAVATPIAGTLGDRFGHRRLLYIGLAGGAATTLLSAFSWNAASIIVFRVLFGLFTACVNPNAMALMMHAYGPERRATAVGWFQFAMTGAPTLGLIAGGPLIDAAGWRAIFVVFAGLNAIALLVAAKAVRAIPRQAGRPLDVRGALLLASGALMGLLAITRLATGFREGGAGAAFSDLVALALVAATAVALTAFVRVERSVAVPMLNIDYFRKRSFSMPLLSGAASQFAYMGGFVVTPALLEGRYGWTIGTIALLMMPRPGVFSLSSPLGGWLPSRIGLRLPIVFGSLSMMAAMVTFAFAGLLTNGLGIALIVAGLVLTGFGAGISQPSIGALTVDSVEPEDMGIANGMNQQVTFVGIVAGIQTMNVFIGDNATGAQFFTTYMLGFAVATLGLVAALAVTLPNGERA